MAMEAKAEDGCADPVRVARGGVGNRVRHLATREGYLGWPSRRTLAGPRGGVGRGGNLRSRGRRACRLDGAGAGLLAGWGRFYAGPWLVWVLRQSSRLGGVCG